MGMRIFGSSSRCEKETSKSTRGLFKACSGGSFLLPTDPNPNIFKFLQIIQGSRYLYVEVLYPNCTNFEGRKILVMDCTVTDVAYMKVLDPHFLEGNKIIARFRPNEEGKSLAKKLINL